MLFLIPYGMLVAELGSAFPVEGGPYEWARMSFGRAAHPSRSPTWATTNGPVWHDAFSCTVSASPAGAVTAVLYWLSNPSGWAAR